MIEGKSKHVEFRTKPSNGSLLDRHGSAIRKVGELVQHAADSNKTVLVQGESDICNELVARSVHFSSSRCVHPFMLTHCGVSAHRDSLETELFGHKKQACSSATTDHLGHFELARHGTLYLADIDELTIRMQAKLERALLEKTIVRISDREPIKIDARIIVSTKTNLRKMVSAGRFREDLYNLLNILPIHIPHINKNIKGFSTFIYAITKYITGESKSEVVINQEIIQTIIEFICPDKFGND